MTSIYSKKKAAPELSGRSATIILIIIWVVAVAVRITLFTGYINGDMGNYIQEAHNFWQGNYSISEALEHHTVEELVPGPKFNWQNLRLGLIVTLGFILKVFGVSDFSCALFSFFCFSLGYYLTYAMGKTIHSRHYGIYAASFYAFIALEINLSTIITPHLPAASFMALSCYLTFKVSPTPSVTLHDRLVISLAGLSAGVAYLMHEYTLLFIPVLFYAIWANSQFNTITINKKIIVLGGFLLVSFGFVFALEQLYFLLISGVPLLRFKIISAMGSKWLALNPIDLEAQKFSIYPQKMFASYYFGLFYYCVFSGFAFFLYRLIKKGKRSRSQYLKMSIPVVWFLWLFLNLQFGSSSLTSYQPFFKIAHYLTILSVPASLVAAYLLTQITKHYWHPLPRIRPQIMWGTAASLMILVGYTSISILFAWVHYAGNGPFRPDLTYEHRIRDALNTLDGKETIYTDRWTKDGLDFVYGYQRTIIAYNPPPWKTDQTIDLLQLENGQIVVNGIYLNSNYTMATKMPAAILSPPPNWQVQAHVAGQSNTIDIYRIMPFSGK